MVCRWNRQWTAEENRHGDLMNKYCYLTGRVNMKVRPACEVDAFLPPYEKQQGTACPHLLMS